MIKNDVKEVIEYIKNEYLLDDNQWVIAYSGGKDSSCLLKLVIEAIKQLESAHKRILILFCDSGVDIPVMRDYALKTLDILKKDAIHFNLPIDVKVIEPRVEERFFSKLIGKGYMPPYYKFRWCTERLRIQPIQSEIKAFGKVTLLLGTRRSESEERSRTLKRYSIDERHFKQDGFPNTIIFSPIVDFSTTQVWLTLREIESTSCIDVDELALLYYGLSGDENQSVSCGRFGCWVCTVVRRDRALESLIEKGYEALKHLYSFKEYIRSLALVDSNRLSIRRNGSSGKGPFTIQKRSEILNELLRVQEETGYKLINTDEIIWIKRQWEIDERFYSELNSDLS